MKTLFTALICFSTYTIFAQTVQTDLRGLASSRGNVANTTISSFSNTTVKGNQYLYETWTSGSVTADDHNIYSAGYSFNFDKINHNLYAKYDGESGISVLIEKVKIAGFTVGNKNFISPKYLTGAKATDKFYQVLVKDSAKVSLYKLTLTKLVKPDMNDVYAVKSGNFTSEFVDNNTFFVSIANGELKKINLTETGVYKALKGYDAKIDEFVKKYSSRDVDEAFLSELVDYLNH